MKYVLWSFALLGALMAFKFWYVAIPLMLVGAFLHRFITKKIDNRKKKA
jgi:hypothetical protein